MKKILLAIDALRPDRHAFDFACYMAKMANSKLTAVFLEDFAGNEDDEVAETYEMLFVDKKTKALTTESVVKGTIIETNIRSFRENCETAGIKYHLHRDRGVPVDELLAECRFADVLIIDAETSFRNAFEGTPTAFLKKILHKAECPVIIAPETFENISEIVFCYDNTASSVFAMKQFTHLFPEYSEKKATVLHICDESWNDIDKYKLREWMGTHYKNLHYETMAGRPAFSLFDFISGKRNHFTVIGAYSRSSFSNFFHRSNADLLIRSTTQPLFIAHV